MVDLAAFVDEIVLSYRGLVCGGFAAGARLATGVGLDADPGFAIGAFVTGGRFCVGIGVC